MLVRGPNTFTTLVRYFCPLGRGREGRQTASSSAHPTAHPGPEHPLFLPGVRGLGGWADSEWAGAGDRTRLLHGHSSRGGPQSRVGETHHLSMVEPLLLFPRGYSSRQINTPAALKLRLRNSPAQPEGPQ